MTTKTFKIWDEQNATGGGGKCLIRQNFITFSSYGKVSFSSGLCSALGLTHESRITFVEGDDGSLFLCKTINTGLIFGQSKSKKNYLQMGARKLCDHLFQTYGFEKSFRARHWWPPFQRRPTTLSYPGAAAGRCQSADTWLRRN